MAKASKSKRRRPKGGAAATRRMTLPRPRLPVLEQRHRDVIGLGLVALGVFLALVLYSGDGGGGGAVGQGLGDALRWLLGVLAYAAPVACGLGGLLLVLHPVIENARPLRTGVICLLAGLTLGLAAGVFGDLGAGARDGWFHAAFMQQRGGVLGEALAWTATMLFSRLGAQILTVFLLLAGAVLVTGGSIAGFVRSGARGVGGAGRRLRTIAPSREALRATFTETVPVPAQPATGADADDAEVDPGAQEPAAEQPPAEDERTLAPPEPENGELVIRAGRQVSPLDGAQRFPDLFGGEPIHFDDEPVREAAEPPAPPPGASAPAEPDAEEEHTPALRELDPDPPAQEPGVTVAAEDLTPQGRYRASVTDDPGFVWKLPDPARLKRSSGEEAKPDTAGQERVAAALIEALGHFGVEAKVLGMVTGPHITRYELRLAPGTKVSKVAKLKDDLAYALAATEIRILAPIPGKQAVGVEVPNARRRIVHLGDVLGKPPRDASPLMVWLGKDVAGRSVGADLARMPHLLVAGTTGAGKSGCVNAMLSSILLRATPHEVRLVLVDPKQVELNHYDSIPHLLTPVITNPRMAANALQNLVREMEERYGMMSLARTRSLDELNAARAKRDDPALPYVLCVIDELADLMMVAPADVEDSIIRLAQKARAVGIHLVLATQSPRVDVITGMIKANVPSRIAFAVSSQTDSRVILDHNGAESLLGKGDMLFSPVGTSKLQRIQGAFIDEAEIAELTEHWRGQGEPEMREDLLEQVEEADGGGSEGGEDELDPDEDPLLEEAMALVAQMGTASTSMLQRRLRLGYTRAGRLIDMLERRGIISGYEGSKPRQVLITEADLPRLLQTVGGGGPRGDDVVDDLTTADERGE